MDAGESTPRTTERPPFVDRRATGGTFRRHRGIHVLARLALPVISLMFCVIVAGGFGMLLAGLLFSSLSEGPFVGTEHCYWSDEARLVDRRLGIYLVSIPLLQWLSLLIGIAVGLARVLRHRVAAVGDSLTLGYWVVVVAAVGMSGYITMWAAHGRDIRVLLGPQCLIETTPHPALAIVLAFAPFPVLVGLGVGIGHRVLGRPG